MSWLFGSGAGAATTAGAGAGTTAALGSTAGEAAGGAGIGAGMSAPGAGAGMSLGSGGVIAGPGAPAAAIPPAVGPSAWQQFTNSGFGQGLGQFGQGLLNGTFGYGQAPNTFWGQFGQQVGQPGPQRPMPQLPPPQQVGQQPLGPLFQRPSQGMDPRLLQQIGMMILGMQR